MAEIDVKETVEKESHVFKYIAIFLVFLAIGVVLGMVGTKKFIEYKDSQNKPVVDEGPEDITDLDEYSDLINRLHSFVEEYPFVYTTKGIKAENLSNNEKLLMIYDALKKDNKIKGDTITATYGTENCLAIFKADESDNPFNPTNVCSIQKVEQKLMEEKSKQIFDIKEIDLTSEFVNSDGLYCMLSEGNYICGHKLNEVTEQGEIVAKFSVVKVTKDEGKIVIYDKGYLLDTRASKISNLGIHEKYYLHSYDSNDYYFELKNADNLTFKHTFITVDRVNYYYVSSELVKE